MPGMRDGGGNFYLGQRANAEGVHGWAGFDRGCWEWHETEFGLPDLTYPATLGCLLALVREAWKDEGIAAVIASYDYESGYQWRVIEGHHHGSKWQTMSQKRFSTEDEALVAALEAAE